MVDSQVIAEPFGSSINWLLWFFSFYPLGNIAEVYFWSPVHELVHPFEMIALLNFSHLGFTYICFICFLSAPKPRTPLPVDSKRFFSISLWDIDIITVTSAQTSSWFMLPACKLIILKGTRSEGILMTDYTPL